MPITVRVRVAAANPPRAPVRCAGRQSTIFSSAGAEQGDRR
jgi:hypothetical protein